MTAAYVTPLEAVTTHADVREILLGEGADFTPSSERGVSKYAARIGPSGTLRALLVNKEADVLVVALHGATNREVKTLPRFEWMRTLRSEGYSSLYFSDPLLDLHDELALAWYTGTYSQDLHSIIATWSKSAALATGARQIVFLGSSGGGFASLQISTFVPGSLALPFSPQTAIPNYLLGGTRYGAQQQYLHDVMPELRPRDRLEDLEPGFDWSLPLGDRLSALRRYANPQENYVFFVQNLNDFVHVDQHYLPFREVVDSSQNSGRVHFELYAGPEGHNPPVPRVFRTSLRDAIAWHSARLDTNRIASPR